MRAPGIGIVAVLAILVAAPARAQLVVLAYETGLVRPGHRGQ